MPGRLSQRDREKSEGSTRAFRTFLKTWGLSPEERRGGIRIRWKYEKKYDIMLEIGVF